MCIDGIRRVDRQLHDDAMDEDAGDGESGEKEKM
jgi:hypothetical protein